MLPLEGGLDLPFTIDAHPPTNGDRYSGDEKWRFVSPRYFAALHIPLLHGRMFDERDAGSCRARRYYQSGHARKNIGPRRTPIGQRISIGKGLGPDFVEPARQSSVSSATRGKVDSMAAIKRLFTCRKLKSPTG